MEKIKIEFGLMPNRIIKMGKQKVEVKPYILSTDIVEISSLCLEQFENGDEPFSRLAWMKCFFDMLVVYKCTNIKIDGIVEKKSKNERNISINLDSKITMQFEMSGIIEKVAPLIINYKDVYLQVMNVIESKNIYNSLKTLVNGLPSTDEIKSVLETSLQTLSVFKEKDPDTFDKILKEQTILNAPQEYKEAKVKKAKKEKKGK